MKTKEFIKKVEELGFGVKKENYYIRILANDFVIAAVYTNRTYCLNTHNPMRVEWRNEDDLFKLMVEYASTPIEEREEEKYRLKHKYIKTRNGNPSYLALMHRPSISYPVLVGSDKNLSLIHI